MPIFTYRATDLSGNMVDGTMEGKDAAAVITRLQDQQFFPLKVDLTTPRKGLSRDFSLAAFTKRIKRLDILIMTQQLSTLMDAGLQLDRCLLILAELNQGQKLQEMIGKIRKSVQGGSSFADALARYPHLFNRLYVNMVRSGESGGVLEVILLRLSDFLESSNKMRDDIISAMIYPLLLLFVGGAAVSILLTFVIPKFATIFAEMGAEMPVPTKVVIAVSGFIHSYWWLIAIILTFCTIGFRNYVRTDKGRIWWDNIKLKTPMFGELVQKIEIARFARTLGTLSRSGVPILQGLSIVKDTLTNEIIASAMIDVYGGIKEGEGLAVPLERTGVFPPLAIHMIRVGEETGALENMLLKVADNYDNDVSTSIRRVMSLVEPGMILFMGLFIGFIVISMLLAIFSISDIAF